MRLAPLDQLTPRQAEVSERIAAKRGATRGPFLIWLRSPELAERVDALGAYCRFDSGIPDRLRELSLLIAARHFDAVYSWNAHTAKATEVGVPAECIERLARGENPRFEAADETLLYEFARQVLVEHFVDDEVFAAALQTWDERGVVDIIGCLGNFSMLAMLLNTFQVDLQPGRSEPYPDISGYHRVAAARPLPPTSV